jgi:hypothetical protein
MRALDSDFAYSLVIGFVEWPSRYGFEVVDFRKVFLESSAQYR